MCLTATINTWLHLYRSLRDFWRQTVPSDSVLETYMCTCTYPSGYLALSWCWQETLFFPSSQANLRAIISSEKQVTQLMSSIDEALAEVARVEETLQVYDVLLGSVKQQMDHIHQENSLLHHITSNKAKLMDEILFLTVCGFAMSSCWIYYRNSPRTPNTLKTVAIELLWPRN